MRIQAIFQRSILLVAASAMFLTPVSFGHAATAALAQGPNIQVSGSAGRAAKGRATRATVTMTIPAGYHANANKVLETYLIPTTLTVTGPAGVTIGTVSYPAGVKKTFSFSNGKALNVYEGNAVMSFTFTVPANYAGSEVVLNAKVRVQSCDDKTCFAPRVIETQIKAKV